MAFVLPTFNLTAHIWHLPNSLAASYLLPDVVTPCNLSFGRRSLGGEIEGNINVCAKPLFPPSTDVRPQYNGADGDILEIPAGSHRFYLVVAVDDFGKGFPNEHRFALAVYALNGQTFNVTGHIAAPVPLP